METSKDTSEPETVSTQSLFATLGLAPEDVDALAQIPESEISVEKLPYLIMQLKAKRTNKMTSTKDTDYRDKSKSAQDKPDTPEKSTADRCKSPLLPRSKRRSGSHDHEHHAKGEGHRKVEWPTGGRRDSRYRKSSRESGDDVDVELADNPTVFPHECALCKCVVNSIKTWKDHILGTRHQSHELRSSHRSSRSSLPPKRPYSSDPVTGEQSMSTTPDFLHTPKSNMRVVVAKFPRGSVTVEELLELGKPFGTIVKNLVLLGKGFLEFSSHKEAQNMVSHYKLKPAFVKENLVVLYLSLSAESIPSQSMFSEPLQKRAKRSSTPSVVCFSRLPAGEGIEAEVLELAGMFGEVQQSEFTNSKALIEMVDWRDADIMVKYYYSNPLRIQGKGVKVSMTNITSLRENSPDPLSRKSDLSKNSRQREESSSSNKNKSDSCSQETTSVHVDKEDEAMESEKQKMLDEEGIQMEDKPGPLDNSTSDIPTCKEEGEKKEDEKRMEEEEPSAKENRERLSEETLEEQEGMDDGEFPENLEDFVTLDELDNTAGADSALDSSETQDGKVLVVWPVKKTPDLELALSILCAPFSRLVKHSLSLYKKEAKVELETAEKAQEMLRFYKDHEATVCRRPVSVSMCRTMKTIESPSGRSVFIRGFPTQKYRWKTPAAYGALFNLAKPFGELTGYFLNKQQGTCYMQFDSTEAAEKMVTRHIHWPRKFWGLMLKVSMCMKGDSLINWKHPKDHNEEKELNKESKKPKSPKRTEKDQNHHSSLPDFEGVCGDPVCERQDSEATDDQDKTPLGPYQPDHSVGVKYVIPVTGFFCKLCNIFYSNEKRAKSEHCCSLEHYNNTKKKHGEVVEDTDGHPDG
ncbi:matrin-3-like [Xyrauchen texanus]|uniref:matrin-3-like n=1 Tax=Xyrauchen texanus TaxID=154827 RepID=UPI0022427B8D|nr:matrin-3-like [Xyrauchen texanus]XP_051980998.1 matrin-3-like [Xyrauchen texanus]